MSTSVYSAYTQYILSICLISLILAVKALIRDLIGGETYILSICEDLIGGENACTQHMRKFLGINL